MKLLLVLTNTFPYGTGEDFLSAELKRASGFDRIMICPCSPKAGSVQTKQLPDGVECKVLPREDLGRTAYAKLLFCPSIQAELFRLVREGRFSPARTHELLYFAKHAEEIYGALKRCVSMQPSDSVVVYSYWLFDAAAAGARFAAWLRKRGVQVKQISRAHGFDIHSERAQNSYLPMRAYLFHHVDRIFPCSDDGAAVLKCEAGSLASKITRSYLGTEDCGIGPRNRQPFHLVSCSYMVPVKRLHLIVEALKLADFPVVWTHIGSGPLEQSIRELADQLPANVTAEFTGQRDNKEILEYYQKTPVSVFVNVSSSEGIPVSVMEACSFGVPVIATDVGGTKEIISGGVNGFLLPADFSPADLLDRIKCFCSMGDTEYQGYCANARRIWKEKFNAAENFDRFYKEISA